MGAVVDRFVAAWGAGTWRSCAPQGDAPAEAASLRLDSSRAGQLLGWSTIYGLDEAVAATAAWYKTFYAGTEDVAAFSAAAIAAYEDAAARASRAWAGTRDRSSR